MQDVTDACALRYQGARLFFTRQSSFARIFLLSIFMVPWITSQTFARDLVQPVLSIEGMTQDQQRVYLDGLADGFQIINVKLQRQGQLPLYCVPEKVVVLGRDLLEFAAEDLQGPQEDLTIGVSGLLGLIERYPCSKEVIEAPSIGQDVDSIKK